MKPLIILLLTFLGCTKSQPKKDIKEARPAKVDTLKGYAAPLTLLLLLFSLFSNAQLQPFLPIYPSVSHDSITIQFRATNTTPATGVTAVMYGSPHSSVISYTNSTYAITFSTVATANWSSYSGCSCSSIDAISGATGGSYIPGVANSAYTADFFNYGPTVANYDINKPQFEITGLNPSTIYTIKMTGIDGSQGFDANPFRYKVIGATSETAIDVNGDVTSQANGATFSLQPDGTGKIKAYVNSVNGQSDYGGISVLQLKW